MSSPFLIRHWSFRTAALVVATFALVILGLVLLGLTRLGTPPQGPAPGADKVFGLGVLGTLPAVPPALREGLHHRGYEEGRNLVIELREVDEREDPRAQLAAELVSIPVDVIIAQGNQSTRSC